MLLKYNVQVVLLCLSNSPLRYVIPLHHSISYVNIEQFDPDLFSTFSHILI